MEIPGTFHEGLVLDGYRLIRPIGAGGFGTVWLAEGESTGDFHAVKIVDASANALERELAAVRRFREFSRQMRSPHLIAIEHVNTHGSALFYVLPLADGGPSQEPINLDWIPDTLAARIEARKTAPTWFSSREILDAFLPIARVVAEMDAHGVVHRDIKPANILFVGSRPCLADIGLLDDDRASLTARGTPGHLPPSWYLEASGQPDMWGLATTLYTLLTGNHPDKIGRANFRWPPQGEASMAPEERQTWERWHAAILRATEEIAHERFLTIESFADACRSGSNAGEISKPGGLPHKRFGILAGISILLLGAAAWLFYWGSQNRNREHSSQSGEGVRVQHVVLQPKEEAPYSPQQSSQHQIVEVPAPEIDFSALADGMKGSVNSVEELGGRTEKLRQNETHQADKK
jgi:serine/threonine protein kinase